MATTVTGNQVYTNIKDLSEIDEVSNGDYLIIETQDGTRVIDFQNFLVPIDNVTFESTITNMQTDISSLSADYVETKSGYLTVGYTLSGGTMGTSISGNANVLPVNWIQSNTIDGNFTNGHSTLNGVTSATKVVNLNTGSYFVSFDAEFDGNAFVELYDNTGSRVLLTSGYSYAPSFKGIISLSQRSQLTFRAYSNTTRTLGNSLPFYVSDLIRTPLMASFQYLTNSTVETSKPDIRTT